MTRGTLFLIHWNLIEAEELAQTLRDKGWAVDVEAENGAIAGKRIKSKLPDAVVVSLRRLPSHGRITAESLRRNRATQQIPIVFVGGDGPALDATRAKLPDATFTTPEALVAVLDRVCPSTARASNMPS